MTTIGAFLQSKLNNMLRWIAETGGPQAPREPTQLEATALAETLVRDHVQTIGARDFNALLQDPSLLPDMVLALQFVISNEQMHDKFWRYLKLFSDTVVS